MLNTAIGVEVTHIPYRGAAPAIQDMIAGQTDYKCSVLSPALPQIEGHLVKPIALLTRNRSAALPTLATAHEQGLTDFDVATWHAIFLPKGTPSPIVRKLNEAAVAAMTTPAVAARLKELGADLAAPERRSPECPEKFVEREIAKWAVPIRAAGLSVEWWTSSSATCCAAAGRGCGGDHQVYEKARTTSQPHNRPNAPPSTPSTTFCQQLAHDVRPRPAPSVLLIAISFRRAPALANRRLATLAQAIRSTIVTAADSTSTLRPTSRTLNSRSGHTRAPQSFG